MANFAAFLDNWLRRLGAAFIILLGLLLITLSFLSRGERPRADGSTSLTQKLVYSAASIENWFFDTRTARFYNHEKKSPNLVILELNDETLAKVGRWPWTRTVHAKMIDHLRQYGAKVVMFDVLFPEPETEQADQALFESIQNFSAIPGNAIVLGYGTARQAEAAVIPFPEALYGSVMSGTNRNSPMRDSFFIDKNNFAAPKYLTGNALFGFISAESDMDGIFRHAQLINEVDKNYLPSLSVAGFSAFFANGQDRKIIVESQTGSNDYLLSIQDGTSKRDIHLNAFGGMKLRFFGHVKNFANVTAHEVILDENPAANEKLKAVFAGKAVLFGSTAFGAHDLRHTPVDAQSPGMYLHANLFHALDQNFVYQEEDLSMLISFALYLAGIIAILAISRMQEPLFETLAALVVLAGIYAIDYFYFAPQGYFIRLSACLLGTFSLYAWFTILNVFKEAREKKKIRATFTRYVSPKIVKEMLANPEKLRVGGEKKEITMLFSDVRDFTSISEKLGAHDLAVLLNVYMGQMTDILFDTDGTLDKYIGDALVGFWGAPLDVPDHAYHGVRGALQMLEALPAINTEFEKRNFPRINVGIGINTGEVSVGNMGSDKIFQYTALGDAMNLASRLESLTKYYGVNLMISEFTLAKMGEKAGQFLIRPLDLVQVKGKTEAVKIYEVIPTWSPWASEKALLQNFSTAYQELYLRRKFSEAAAVFAEILARIPGDKNTLKLQDSCRELMESPPASDWAGVTVFTTK